MRLLHLTLRNFRNYRELELDLPAGPVLFCGDNTQGKSNLLEAIYLLAILKSHRAEQERELVNFKAGPEDFARVVGTVEKRGGPLKLQVDLLLRVTPGPQGGFPGPETSLQKRVRVNGVPRPVSEAVGLVNAVLFSAEDILLLQGPPTLRRRFMDILISQLDRAYLRSLQKYQRVLTQRNHLLRLMADGRSHAEELGFWDKELLAAGAFLTQRRKGAIEALAPLAAAFYTQLQGEQEVLGLRYLPTVQASGSLEELKATYARQLEALRPREVGAGLTLLGPHRDDLQFTINAVDLATYGSRGQARSAALALRLAEARFLAQQRGEEPVVLLDDVLSELDAKRRHQVLEVISRPQQTLITTVDLDRHREPLLEAMPRFLVHRGAVIRQE